MIALLTIVPNQAMGQENDFNPAALMTPAPGIPQKKVYQNHICREVPPDDHQKRHYSARFCANVGGDCGGECYIGEIVEERLRTCQPQPNSRCEATLNFVKVRIDKKAPCVFHRDGRCDCGQFQRPNLPEFKSLPAYTC